MPPRIFMPESLAADRVVALPAPAVRHVQALRLQPGDALVVFDGSDDIEWPATIVEIGRSRVAVRLGAKVAVARELVPEVTLAVGVPANDRMDALVEKAGELGAAAIQPLVCARSVLRLSGERAELRRRHWQAVAASASEQCGRARVATVLPIAPLAAWLRASAPATPRTRIVLSLAPSALAPEPALAAHGASATMPEPPFAAHGTSATSPRPAIVVLSGPEGGLAPDEEDDAVAHGFVRVGLGARVLRADTAPLAWLAWLGLHTLGNGRRER